MPIYEYRRPDGTTFDVLQKFSDDALTVDPESGVPVKRVLSAPAIHFKGSGFYNTDYGTRKRPVGGDSSSSTSSSTTSGGDGASSGGSSSGGDGAAAPASTSSGSSSGASTSSTSSSSGSSSSSPAAS